MFYMCFNRAPQAAVIYDQWVELRISDNQEPKPGSFVRNALWVCIPVMGC